MRWGLAINSAYGRSQDQLHIHIDCLRPDVRTALRATRLGDDWSDLPAPLAGWRARRWAGAGIGAGTGPMRDPFRMIATPAADMGRHTLVLTGAVDPPGFVLLDRQAAPPLDRGHGESLLDHQCGVATRRAAEIAAKRPAD